MGNEVVDLHAVVEVRVYDRSITDPGKIEVTGRSGTENRVNKVEVEMRID